MALISWTDEFLTGIESIDEQHHAMVNATNKLHEISTSPDTNVSQVSDLLFELLDQAINHFITEEELFQRLNFPDFPAHKQDNDSFNLKAQTMIQELGDGNSLTEETIEYLKNWITEHILYKDKSYAHFLKENGVQ